MTLWSFPFSWGQSNWGYQNFQQTMSLWRLWRLWRVLYNLQLTASSLWRLEVHQFAFQQGCRSPLPSPEILEISEFVFHWQLSNHSSTASSVRDWDTLLQGWGCRCPWRRWRRRGIQRGPCIFSRLAPAWISFLIKWFPFPCFHLASTCESGHGLVPTYNLQYNDRCHISKLH